MARRPLIAILRGVTKTEVVAIAEALVDAGFSCVETPLNSPEPFESMARLAVHFGDRLCVGAGTVLSVDDVRRTKDSGGSIAVSPNTDPAVIAAARALGLAPLPGFATPTEALAAVSAGARTLKLFPASTYGPDHLRAVRAVLPKDVRIYAVGGFGASALPAWIAAGAAGFGIGGEIYRPGDDADVVSARAKAFVAAWDRAGSLS